MNDTVLLIGSLSNDLFRVANLTHRGSHKNALRFFAETKRWSKELQKKQNPLYIQKIVVDISQRTENELSIALAERYLMYGVLLQNYALHFKESGQYNPNEK